MRPVPHEITLLAIGRNEDGTRSILDIVETSNHHAYRFARAWMRDPQVAEIGTHRPAEGKAVLPSFNRHIIKR